MTQKRDQAKALFELWAILQRYRWRFVLPMFFVSAVVLGMGLLVPRKYKAEASFERQTDMVLTEITMKGAPQSFQNPRGSLIEEVAGPPAIDRLLDTLEPELRDSGVIRTDLDLHRLRSELVRRVVVHWDIASREQDRVRVEYIGQDPKLAELVVNTLVRNYIDDTRSAMEGRLRQSAQFFQNEIDRNRKIIEHYENQVLEFEIEHADLLPENPNNIQAQITTAQERLNDLIAQRQATKTRMDGLSAAVDAEQPTVPSVVKARNPDLKQLEDKRRQLKQTLTEYVSVLKMKEKHPDLVALRQQIEMIEQEMAGLDEEVVVQRQLVANTKRAELELQLTAARSEHKALVDQVVDLETKIAAMNAEAANVFQVRTQYSKLNRQEQQAQRQLAFWEDNLRRVDMSLAAESGDRGVRLEFIRPAVVSYKPVSPNLAQVIMAALAFGLLAGALAVFFAHRGNESFMDGERAAESLGLPLFGAVSEIISRQQRRLRRLRHMIIYPANAAAMSCVLVLLGTVLYLDLERPAVTGAVKTQTKPLITEQDTHGGDGTTPEASTKPVE